MRPTLRVQLVSRREAVLGAAALAACARAPGETAEPVALESIDPITPNDDFYVTSCCGTPTVDRAAWSIVVADRGKPIGEITPSFLDGLPAREREHTLACIGGGPRNQAISNAVWTGLPLSEVLSALGLGVPAGAIEMKFQGVDGYTTALPVADLDRPVWLVWKMNGEDLPPDHGYPARLLVPGRYGMKNPKWIELLDFVDEPHIGFWEAYGWSNDATYQAHTLVRSPTDRSELPAGPARAIGTAFAGSDPVEKVELSFDGVTWTACTVEYSPGADIWTLWSFDWDAVPGEYVVQVRCFTASGSRSGKTKEGSGNYDGYDGSMAISLLVT